MYVDYLSPGAREWQLANAPQLTSWVNEGAATLTYYPVSMLTAKSNGTKYSLRTAGAAACVATHAPDTFYTYNNELLSNQPEVDSDGMTDVQLADLAQASGVDDPKTVRKCIENGDYIYGKRRLPILVMTGDSKRHMPEKLRGAESCGGRCPAGRPPLDADAAGQGSDGGAQQQDENQRASVG